jgi:hypothetical protein
MRAEALLEFRWLGFANAIDTTVIVLVNYRYSQLRIAVFLLLCSGVAMKDEWE